MPWVVLTYFVHFIIEQQLRCAPLPPATNEFVVLPRLSIRFGVMRTRSFRAFVSMAGIPSGLKTSSAPLAATVLVFRVGPIIGARLGPLH
jgi:hypothetical protein